MGCTSSSEHVDGQPKKKPTPADVSTKPSSAPSPAEEKKIFLGVSPNQVVLCRDEFQSKYTEELMYRWRPAEILAVEGDNKNKLLVHYTGWADTFDHWVDLAVDKSKLAPAGLLSKDQCNKGSELTEEQAEITNDYFLHGKEYSPFVEPALTAKELSLANSISNSEDATQKAIETALNGVRQPPAVLLPAVPQAAAAAAGGPAPVIAKRRASAGQPMRPPGEDTDSEKSAALPLSPPVAPHPKTPASSSPPPAAGQQSSLPAPVPPSAKKILAPVRLTAATDPNRNPYTYGDKVDVLDIFFKKGATAPSQKWRSADVVEVVNEYITIHYQNWDDKYNERLHFIKDAHRLAPPGTRTQRPAIASSGASVTSGRSNNSRSSESMRVRSESGCVSNSSHPSSSAGASMAASSSGATPVSVPPSHFMRPPSGQAPENGGSGVAKRLSYTDESSELDKGAHRRIQSIPAPIVTTAAPVPAAAARSSSSDRNAASTESKQVSLAAPSTDHADSELTPEQRTFTRNFYNYMKKKQADVQANAASIPEDGPAEESKKNQDGKSTRKGFSKMTFGGLFGSAKDGTASQLASKSGSPRSVGQSGSSDPNENGDTVAVAVEAEPIEDERNEEEIAARERTFLEKLEAKGLHVFAIEGDGNCLFRAVSHQLYLEQDMHDELRARCVEHLIRHRKRFEVFCDGDFDEHLKEMSKSGTWGDDLEIRALEEITDRVITIYSSNVEGNYEPINNNFEEKNLLQGVPPLTLSYHGQSHYNSIYDERYPLPLVERKSRLLLRSRLALTQQDLLPSLASHSEESSSRPGSTHGSAQGSPRHSTSTANGSRAHHQSASDDLRAGDYNYIARSSSTGNGSLNTHMNGSYSQYDDYDAYPQSHTQAQAQAQGSGNGGGGYSALAHATPMQHVQHLNSSLHSPPPHNTPHHAGHPPAHPQHHQHPQQLAQHQYGYRQGYLNQLGQFVETEEAYDYETPYEQAAYDPSAYDQGYEEEVYLQQDYHRDFIVSDPNHQQHQHQHQQHPHSQQNYAYNNGYAHPNHPQVPAWY